MNRRSRQRIPFIQLIVLGIFAGVAFLVFDTLSNRSGSPSSDTPGALVQVVLPTATVANAGPEDVATPIPQVAETNLFIPSAGIFAPIVEVYLDGESWNVSQLGMNVGHLQGTPEFGVGGNVVLSAHVEMSDGRRGIFATLVELETGDLIEVQQNDTVWRYAVSEISTTTPDDLSPLYPTTTPQLTLITCGNYNFIQNAYLDRIIVTAVPLS